MQSARSLPIAGLGLRRPVGGSCKFGVWGLWFVVCGSGVWFVVCGTGFEVFGFWVLGSVFGFWVLVFGVRCVGLGCTV